MKWPIRPVFHEIFKYDNKNGEMLCSVEEVMTQEHGPTGHCDQFGARGLNMIIKTVKCYEMNHKNEIEECSPEESIYVSCIW